MKITGIGTDIIEVGRIKHAMTRHRAFIARVFTPAEQEYCLSYANPAERFAGRFAAKEAVAKSLGISLSWQDVEILPADSGNPIVELHGKAADMAHGRSIIVSISHCRSYAVAYAIAVSD